MYKEDPRKNLDLRFRHVTDVLAENNQIESLKKVAARNKPFDRKLFDAGMEWFNSGLTLEDAGENADNLSFVNGYRHAERLAFIQELDRKNGNVR